MNKMLMLVYNEAIDAEVMEMLEKSGIRNFTKTRGVFGRGSSSGTHLGNDIWPGLNNLLFAACEEKEAKSAFEGVKELRKTLGKEGVKAFLLPLEALT
ncbi:MAG: hypothetical protein KJ880_06385 [Candidatus Omnitrophica bacterium]|nr:hypothetical protein [Candidatus Omnitrophota bacterium]MBU1870154.1 hypothetical protein [Candidatus Omnitrophota bacterium]